MQPSSEHAHRLATFQETLRARGLDGALLVHGLDVFYFTGTRQNAALFVPASGAAALLVRKSLARASQESAVEARPFPPSRELAGVLGGARRVGFTFDVAPVALLRFYERALPGVELADVSLPLREQRSVKSPSEVERIRETGALMSGVLREVPNFLAPGMREIELAAEIEYRLRRRGNEGTPPVRSFGPGLFVGVVTAGASATKASAFDGPVTGCGLSPAAPLGASAAAIAPDAPIILDYTAVKAGYLADMTRVAVCGRLSPELARAFDVALAIQDLVAAALRPGAIPSQLWQAARERADAAGLSGCFMGPPGDQARFVGHGIGLELDELPVLAPGFDAPLVEGQTIAVEPKFVFPGQGAVGIENTWAVGPQGGVRLTELEDRLIAV
jgi:Xaa-Pro aminopeptidase